MVCSLNLFQSTPPARGATLRPLTEELFADISIHAPTRGATTVGGGEGAATMISIHAPREGGDNGHLAAFLKRVDFNPRPPREGGDLSLNLHLTAERRISIHAPPRGGRPTGISPPSSNVSISIHAPPRGGRRLGEGLYLFLHDFNPRPPARGATHPFGVVHCPAQFQSTPPREGGDPRAGCSAARRP